MALTILVTVWVVCGALAYGQELADIQRRFPFFAWRYRNTNRIIAAYGAILGPVGLGIALWCAERQNRFVFNYKVLDKEASWQAFREMFGDYPERF